MKSNKDVTTLNSANCFPLTTSSFRVMPKVYNATLLIPAPETQTQSICSILSDMFSLGMVVCAIFNHGRPLIQAGNSTSAYVKQLELVSTNELDFKRERIDVTRGSVSKALNFIDVTISKRFRNIGT